jgi:hypothetical protein
MVSMINWWAGDANIQDTWFQKFFTDCSRDYNIDLNNICIIGTFGSYYNIINCDKTKVNIYFTGENTYRREFFQFSNEQHISNYVDAVCGFFNNTSKSIRMPLWTIYLRYDLYGLFNPVEETIKEDKAVVVVNHDIDGFRNNICQQLMNKGLKVDTSSSIIKNANLIKVGQNVSGKLDTLKHYKYNVCCENTVQQGYTTEKIFDSFMSGCIPIYRGDNPVEPKVLKQEQIIYTLEQLNTITEFSNKNIWMEKALTNIYSVYLKLWSVVVKKLNPTKKSCENKVTYNCSNVDDCVSKLSSHWETYNNFHTPRAEFILENNEVLWMEDIADSVYSKYNLNYS